VAAFLTDDWLDAVRAAAPSGAAPGLTVRLEVAAGNAKFAAVVVDGELRELTSGGLPDADVSLTVPLDDAVAIQRGELAPSVAFMQGRLKTAGDPGKLLELLGHTATPGYAAFRDAVAAATTF